MAGAKKRMLDYLLDHIGEEVNRETLREIAVISDWARFRDHKKRIYSSFRGTFRNRQRQSIYISEVEI